MQDALAKTPPRTASSTGAPTPQSPMLTTAEVADYLRVKERTIYEMVARQTIPFSRATGKLLFPRRLVDAWLEAQTELPGTGIAPAPPIYAGSNDPLLEWALRQSGSGLAVLARGSSQGLEDLAAGRAVLAGLHLLDPESGEWNRAAARAHLPGSRHVLIHWARRTQGLITAPGNPLGITGLKDACARGLRFATRAGGAGSSRLLEVLLTRAGLTQDDLESLERPAETHADLATLIETGEADLGLGLQAAAGHLGFLPLVTNESFDLAMTRRDYFEPPIQTLLAFARTDSFARRAEHLGGYDLTDLGKVLWNA
ncbi:MAG: helix-turn-helix transcriptional regulator [Rhodobacteraceae bacterium]|nr:helix-turn-helix transcriptional regulator [Paracoccaceae bacterium]